MGHRANLVIVTENGYELYYDHWLANTLPFQVFWGPEHALKLIRLQAQREPDQWTNPVFAEGGILIDPFEKVVLLFGGTYISWDLSFQAVFIECMGYRWPGWTIQWAHRELYDIADYLGILYDFCQRFPPKELAATFFANAKKPTFGLISLDERYSILLSIRFNDDKVYFFPLDDRINDLLYSNLADFDVLQQHLIYQEFDLAVKYEELVDCLHLDMQQQQIHVWDPSLDINLHFPPHHWQGWSLQHHGGDFSSYASIVSQRVKLPNIDYAHRFEWLRYELLQDQRNGAYYSILRDLSQDHDQSIKLHANTLLHREYHLPLEQREILLAETEAVFRQAHGL
ncbi:MAG: hypothetical protein LCH85_11565 [Chloroflexi bacterium]|nr:hypothetical protein [Chloroflexota bacterium]